MYPKKLNKYYLKIKEVKNKIKNEKMSYLIQLRNK